MMMVMMFEYRVIL